MIETGDLLVFAKVVELESLTRAATGLGVPKSTVSRRLTRLEEKLGAQLLRRTTHGITITEQGQVFFEYAQRCLGVLRDGANAVQVQHSRPRGLLRISVPHELDRTLLAPLLTDYLKAYPDVRLVTVLSNETVDHFRDGFDVAIVADTLPLAEASLMTTKLGATEYGLYAAPDYLERHGVPQSHVDLPRFDLLAWGSVDVKAQWHLDKGADHAIVAFRPRLICNDLMLLRQSVLSGLGVAALPAFICKRDLAEGRMAEVLPGWRPPGKSFFAVFPHHQVMPVRVRAFIDFLVERLRPTLSWEMNDGR
ncbi:MAG: Transcriptional regulator, LysR family [Sphingomonas bacterium]|uniref:LysR family transcriptional regulator n=1 Tax=Sphingomonas bacterium TaxID=1895847 RepID=UPI002605D361|nr:LysR family transcriptional regulator [Sphingomonas bacterium]MDB5705091.1 Transcriptional regulator, LysR family [Sphingomonas bacterium]